MNGRILELAKNPELFQIKDLELLTGEINKHPYIQSLRALHLLGTHRLNPENYANQLSVTAAFTTDKKILYQLINLGEESKSSSNTKEISVEKPATTKELTTNFTEIESKVIETPKSVFVDGELNRILFEGEEEFLQQETETIDLESTLESGQIVTQKLASETIITNSSSKFSETKDAESFSKEIIIQEAIISNEKPIIDDANELSFHATPDFLPEVKMVSNPVKKEVQEIPKPILNKHEEEMKRLISEVEAKMKASKKEKPSILEQEDISESATINFSETQSFEYSKREKIETPELDTIVKNKEVETKEIQLEAIQIKTDPIPEKSSDWKPMSFSTNTPDALISKKEEAPASERPIFNVSFFTQNVSAHNKEAEIKEIPNEPKTTESLEVSNVASFINTWQSWLKIDRTKQEAKEKISITEIKNKVIENFIEKEPRISKLKEESDFVIRERNDDISHLMTETLANLYTEQKLYAKAIKAYGILSEKHPEKKSHFNNKIKEVKELRQNK